MAEPLKDAPLPIVVVWGTTSMTGGGEGDVPHEGLGVPTAGDGDAPHDGVVADRRGGALGDGAE